MDARAAAGHRVVARDEAELAVGSEIQFEVESGSGLRQDNLREVVAERASEVVEFDAVPAFGQEAVEKTHFQGAIEGHVASDREHVELAQGESGQFDDKDTTGTLV